MASTHHGVVYTKKWVVDLILDVAGYVPGTGISDKVIIEPSCGCGAFLTVIAGRLADDAIAVGKGWTSLGNAIRAYDIDSASIETARKAAVEALMTEDAPQSRLGSFASSGSYMAISFLMTFLPLILLSGIHHTSGLLKLTGRRGRFTSNDSLR